MAGSATWHPNPAPAPTDGISGGQPLNGVSAINPYQPQQLPFDAGYSSAVNSANTQYDVTNAGLQYQQGRINQDYGFTDTSNPFNRAAMLERSYHQSQAGTLNSNAAGGQLYSGANQRQLDEGTFTYSRNRDTLQRQYQDALQGVAQQRAQAGADRASAISSAYGDRIDRAMSAAPTNDPGSPVSGSFPHQNPSTGQYYRIVVQNGVRGHLYQDGHFVPAKRKK